MLNSDCFIVLEYIRSSIEIIMNLKIEDLENNDPSKKRENIDYNTKIRINSY